MVNSHSNDLVYGGGKFWINQKLRHSYSYTEFKLSARTTSHPVCDVFASIISLYHQFITIWVLYNMSVRLHCTQNALWSWNVWFPTGKYYDDILAWTQFTDYSRFIWNPPATMGSQITGTCSVCSTAFKITTAKSSTFPTTYQSWGYSTSFLSHKALVILITLPCYDVILI